MRMSMNIAFLLCGIFLIPDIFSSAKSTEKFFWPEDYEEVQDYGENFKENIAEPSIIEEIETKDNSNCPGNIPQITPPTRTCNGGPYEQLVLVNGTSNAYVPLTRCLGHYTERTICKATRQRILVKANGRCVIMYNETNCKEECKTSKNNCKNAQTFNHGSCKCEPQTLF